MIKLPQCPICNKTLAGATVCESKFLPFCSERCRNVDLFRWFEGKYAIVEPLDPLRLAVEAEALEQRRTEVRAQADDSER